MECNVCITPFNNSNRKRIDCPRCNYPVCQTCVRTYILQSHFELHCMKCRLPWDHQFIGDHLPINFLKDEYKKHRAEVLFEQQCALFPQTIPLIQKDKDIEKIRENIRLLLQSRAEIDKKIVSAQRHLYYLQSSNTIRNENKSARIPSRPCVYGDCKGYLDESNGVCGLCDRKTCLDCNIAVSCDDHLCLAEDVANWMEIKRSTRPCPKCQTRIHRISGCNQMWCPQCHTPFNYSNGQIEKGPIHNPHYYEYIQSVDRFDVNDDDLCHHNNYNNPPEIIYFTSYLKRCQEIENKEAWLLFHRLVTHVQTIEIPKYHVTNEFTLDLRKAYLRNYINKEVFKKRIQERDKRFRKNREMSAIWEMFLQISNDILHDIFQHLRNKQCTSVYIQNKEIERTELIDYVNRSIFRLNRNFQSRLSHIHRLKYIMTPS